MLLLQPGGGTVLEASQRPLPAVEQDHADVGVRPVGAELHRGFEIDLSLPFAVMPHPGTFDELCWGSIAERLAAVSGESILVGKALRESRGLRTRESRSVRFARRAPDEGERQNKNIRQLHHLARFMVRLQ
jgi:hypothetical protein